MLLLHHAENGAARLALQLDPARQDIVELQRGQIGVDAHAAVAIRASDLAGQLDRNSPADRRSEIEPQARAAGIVERRLQFDIGIAFDRFAIIHRGRLPIDLDLALDLIALIVGDDFQRIGFELLIHHQAIRGKSAEVGRNGIARVGLGQFALDRQAERDYRRHRSLARIGIDQGAGKFAETIQGQNLGRRRHRTIDPEFYPRRRGFRRHIRHLEHKI